MNNSCKIAAGRSPERFSEITVSPGRQKYRFITPFFLHFRAPTLLRREDAGNPSMTRGIALPRKNITDRSAISNFMI